MNTLLLLAALLGQTFPTNDNRPGGAVNMTGCASYANGTVICSPSNGTIQFENSVGGGATLQCTSIDTTTAGTLTVGGTNATGVQVGNASAPVTIYGGVSMIAATATSAALQAWNSAVTRALNFYVDLTNGFGITPIAPSGAAPLPMLIKPGNVDPTRSDTGANVNLSGGAGAKSVTFVAYDNTCPTAHAGSTPAQVVVTPSTGAGVTFVYGTGYCVSACANVTAAATSFCTALAAKGGTLTGVTCTTSAGKVMIALPWYMPSLASTTSDTTCHTVSNGTDGQVLLAANSTAYPNYTPNLASLLDPTTGFVFDGNAIRIVGSSSYVGYINSGGLTMVGKSISAGTLQSTSGGPTAGSMLFFNSDVTAGVYSAYWYNADVVALGASLTGNISVMVLPAKTIVRNAYLIINTACTDAGGTLTVSIGRVGGAYIDYIVASDATAAAYTVYGTTAAQRGTNLTGFDLPSFTGSTTIYAHFISTVNNLSAVTTCTGHISVETELVQ